MVRKLDSIGRIAIPKDLRRKMQWMEGDEIEVIEADDKIILQRPEAQTISDKVYSLREDWKAWAQEHDFVFSEQTNYLFNDLIEKLQEQERLS